MNISMTIAEALELSSLKSCKVIAGKKGLDREIRWIHMAELLENICDITNWTEGNELILLTGVGIKSEEMFIDFVTQLNNSNISGLIIFLGQYITDIPEKVIDHADALNFPIITLPWSVPAVKVTDEICEQIIKCRTKRSSIRSIMENLLLFENADINLLINQASYYGYNLNRTHQVLIADINKFSEYIKKNKIVYENHIIDLKDRFFKMVESVLKTYYSQFAITMISDTVICLVASNEMERKKIVEVADITRANTKKYFNGMTTTVTIGKPYTYVKDFKKSLNQAQKALDVLKKTGEKDITVCYDELGADMLLIELKDNKVLNEFYKSTLGKILIYDKTNKSELGLTLKTYLDENGSSNKSAEKLFIHRNTMKYRLDKIHDITGYDLQDTKTLFNLKLAYQIEKLL